MTQRPSALVALAAVGAFAVGCGGSSSPSAGSSPSTASTPPASGASTPAAPGVPTLTGASVPAEIDGYAYTVGPAAVASLATTYTSGAVSGTTHDAPPNTDYVLVWVKVTNAATDRQEPAPVYQQHFYDVPADLFGIAVPNADKASFGSDCQDVSGSGLPTSVPVGFCGYSASLTSASTLPSDHQIPAGESVYLQLAVGPVPANAPVADVTLFVKNCVLGPTKQQGCDSAQPVKVPRAGA